MGSIVELLSIGLSIKISRSDGRIHAATVKAVHPEKSAVSVEWLENSATKGKEVDFGELRSLNQELLSFLKTSSHPEPPLHRPHKSEVRLRSSRIPAPPEVHRRTMARRTCAVPAGVLSQPSGTLADDCALVAEQTGSSLLNGSGLSSKGSRGKRKVKTGLPMSSTALPRVTEDAMDTEMPAGRGAATVSSARRKSGAASDAEKIQNKRRATQAKNNGDLGPKRGNRQVLKDEPWYEQLMQGTRTGVRFPKSWMLTNIVGPIDTEWTNYGAEMHRPHGQFYKMIEEYRETLEITPISLSDSVEDHRICVCVRKRPLNKQEVARKEIDVVSVPGKGVLLLHEPKQKVDLTKYLENQLFKFDYSFNETATNDMVYRFTAKPLVQTIFEGGVATCFAYGQTGSGKTHTMGGGFSGKNQNSSSGIYALAAEDVFALLEQRRFNSMGLDAYVTFFEIYNGKVFDLLNKKAKLRVLEDGKQQVQVVGLQEVYVSSPRDVIKLIEMGSACRTSGQTFANANSSRSHAVLQIVLRQKNRLHGKFSLVDLAGNERGTDVSSNDRQTLVETAEINRSLLALKECIRSLGKNSDHIPFRMSTLTQVLRDSFIGEKSRTCMIAMISPGMSSCDYTLNTLRYADRVKELNIATNGNDFDKKSGTDSQDDDDDDDDDDTDDEESLEKEDTLVRHTSVYEAVSQVTEMENRICEVLNKGKEIANSIEEPLHDINSIMAELMDHANTLQECVSDLRAAAKAEETARTSKKAHF